MTNSFPREQRPGLMRRLGDWLVECIERAQIRDHDRYLASARNPREASQWLHLIQQGGGAFHV